MKHSLIMCTLIFSNMAHAAGGTNIVEALLPATKKAKIVDPFLKIQKLGEPAAVITKVGDSIAALKSGVGHGGSVQIAFKKLDGTTVKAGFKLSKVNRPNTTSTVILPGNEPGLGFMSGPHPSVYKTETTNVVRTTALPGPGHKVEKLDEFYATRPFKLANGEIKDFRVVRLSQAERGSQSSTVYISELRGTDPNLERITRTIEIDRGIEAPTYFKIPDTFPGNLVEVRINPEGNLLSFKTTEGYDVTYKIEFPDRRSPTYFEPRYTLSSVNRFDIKDVLADVTEYKTSGQLAETGVKGLNSGPVGAAN